MRGATSTPIDTASWITLRWVRSTGYYCVHLEQDLWRNWLLTQVNGRIGTRLGRARSKPTPSSIETATLYRITAAQSGETPRTDLLSFVRFAIIWLSNGECVVNGSHYREKPTRGNSACAQGARLTFRTQYRSGGA